MCVRSSIEECSLCQDYCSRKLCCVHVTECHSAGKKNTGPPTHHSVSKPKRTCSTICSIRYRFYSFKNLHKHCHHLFTDTQMFVKVFKMDPQTHIKFMMVVVWLWGTERGLTREELGRDQRRCQFYSSYCNSFI